MGNIIGGEGGFPGAQLSCAGDPPISPHLLNIIFFVAFDCLFIVCLFVCLFVVHLFVCYSEISSLPVLNNLSNSTNQFLEP